MVNRSNLQDYMKLAVFRCYQTREGPKWSEHGSEHEPNLLKAGRKVGSLTKQPALNSAPGCESNHDISVGFEIWCHGRHKMQYLRVSDLVSQ